MSELLQQSCQGNNEGPKEIRGAWEEKDIRDVSEVELRGLGVSERWGEGSSKHYMPPMSGTRALEMWQLPEPTEPILAGQGRKGNEIREDRIGEGEHASLGRGNSYPEFLGGDPWTRTLLQQTGEY